MGMKDQDCRIWPVIVSIIRRGPFIGEAATREQANFFSALERVAHSV
jgi:hypothetical protein